MASKAVKSYILFVPVEGWSKARARITITAAVFMIVRSGRKTKERDDGKKSSCRLASTIERRARSYLSHAHKAVRRL